MKKSYIEVIEQLDKFASSFSSISTIDELALAVEKILEETYGVEYTGIYLYDSVDERFKLLQAKGFNEHEILTAEKTALERHPGMVYRSGKMIYIPDTFLDDKELTKSSERSFVVRSRLYLPVRNGEQVVGAFGIVDSKPNAYNNEDIAVLSFICNIAGAMYGNILNKNLLISANKQILSLSTLPVESPNPVLRISYEMILLYANNACRSLLDYHGLKEGEQVNNDFKDQLTELIRTGKTVDWETSDGNSTYALQFTLVEGKEYINIFGRDITTKKELENALIKSDARHGKMVANISDVIVIINEKGINTYKSPNLEKLFGWKSEELIGIDTFENIHPDDLEATISVFETALLAQDGTVVAEFRYRCKDGSYKWVHFTGVNLFHDPDIRGILGNYHDISASIKAKSDLEESESRYRLLFENMEEGFSLHEIITDGNGEAVDFSFLEANSAYERHTGMKISECIGKTMLEILPNADSQQIIKYSEVALTGKPLSFEYYSKTFNKHIRVRAFCPQPGRFASIFEDITEQKEAEEDLNKILQAVEQSPVMTYITDPMGLIEFVNPKVSEITGYLKEELIGQNPWKFSSSEIMNEDYAILWQTIKSGKDWKGEFHKRKKSGELYWVMASISPVFDEKGLITHFIAVEEDITHRKEQYTALKIANLRFESLISSIQAGVMVEDEQRRVVLVNQYFCDLFSIPVPPENLIGYNCADAAEESKWLFDDPEAFISDIKNTLSLRQVISNFQLEMKDGISLERDFVPIDDPDKNNQGILWIYRNITERKKGERDLLRQREILSGTATAMNYLLTIPDHDQAMQKALESVGIATGVDRAYIFQSNIDDTTGETFLSQLFEWTSEGVIPQIENPDLHNMPFSKEFPRWFKLLSQRETLSGLVKDFPDNERKLLEPQDIISLIVVPVFVNDLFWGTVGFDDCSKGITWSSNEVSILTALAASIGGSISREIIGKELTNAIQIAENATKTKSDFLATMSHEIRTPMNGVIGMTSLLLQTQLTHDQYEYADTIKISGELLLDLINEILDFAKIESGKMVLEEQQFDLRMAIEDTLDLTSTAAIKKKLGIYYFIDPTIPQMITGDLTRLRQILVNLVGNAIKFTEGGEVVIKIKQLEIQKDEVVLEFTVSDTGIGIPQEKIDTLFKPFSQVDPTTTRKYGGSGLGLAISQNLIKLMNGDIKVNSVIEQGSVFTFTIKTSYNQKDEQPDSISSNQKVIKGKKILIVDNHQTNNSILSTLFRNLGLETFSVNSAEKSIKLLQEVGDFDLIVIDNELPDIPGIELVSEIKKLKNCINLPQILVTYPYMSESGFRNDNRFQIRINKPIKQSQLILHVTNLLSGLNSAVTQNNLQTNQLKMLNEKYPLKILVAEDNAINQKLILRLFQVLGYNIQIAANGYEVIEILNRMKIDIVFMDIQMPEMDGLETTKCIIEQWGKLKPLIVAMTANAMQSDKEKYLAAGMDDYISKPLTINQVSAGIEKWALLCNKK